MSRPPDFPSSPYPLLGDGGLTPAAQENAVVSIATQYLGIPYQWGGASPKAGFDCSGLVQYVFAQFGVSLPHYAAAQYYSPESVWVPPGRLQPGDLVFFTGSDGTRKAPGHVGIYVGDGYLIDAPHRGSVVRIDSLDERWFANKYVGAKRVVGISLDARHLLDVTQPAATVTATGFPLAITDEPLGESLRIAAAGTVAAQPTPRRYWIWAGVIFGGALLLLFAGGLVVRRRQRVDTSPSTDSSA
jgi:NlpC/P60 family